MNIGRVLTHDQLLRRIWGLERTGEPGLVRNVVKRPRGKLRDDADNPTYIATEPRVGYRMPRGESSGSEEQDGRRRTHSRLSSIRVNVREEQITSPCKRSRGFLAGVAA